MWGKHLAPVGMLSPGAIVTFGGYAHPSPPQNVVTYLFAIPLNSNKDSKPQNRQFLTGPACLLKKWVSCTRLSQTAYASCGVWDEGCQKGLPFGWEMGWWPLKTSFNPRFCLEPRKPRLSPLIHFPQRIQPDFPRGVMQEGGYPEPLTTHFLQSSLDMSILKGLSFLLPW